MSQYHNVKILQKKYADIINEMCSLYIKSTCRIMQIDPFSDCTIVLYILFIYMQPVISNPSCKMKYNISFFSRGRSTLLLSCTVRQKSARGQVQEHLLPQQVGEGCWRQLLEGPEGR